MMLLSPGTPEETKALGSSKSIFALSSYEMKAHFWRFCTANSLKYWYSVEHQCASVWKACNWLLWIVCFNWTRPVLYWHVFLCMFGGANLWITIHSDGIFFPSGTHALTCLIKSEVLKNWLIWATPCLLLSAAVKSSTVVSKNFEKKHRMYPRVGLCLDFACHLQGLGLLFLLQAEDVRQLLGTITLSKYLL